jgi:adenine specific DNA methylase Mod
MPTTKQAENTASGAQRAKATNAGLIELQIEYRSVTDIVLDPRNPRQHSQLQLALHPTGKPVHLVMDALLDCSRRGDIVLDSFLGSGTTLLAAERTGRIFRGIELDPLYIDTAIRRWQNLTGHDAVRAADGRLFREIEAEKEDADER